MMTITGSVRCTETDWLPVLSNIAPVDIDRELATSKLILRARGKPELPLLTDIDFLPRPRLKSRRPIWSNIPVHDCQCRDVAFAASTDTCWYCVGCGDGGRLSRSGCG